ncbi:hypothetical protein CAC42_4273 [Sphaceloma murrayae]|uniref:Uncharacterized protein n=1 Tax=Sphaceloma murrayae TaxID=2082308 RepID=A0A2K1QLI8_9PEZI|nr:hypothetical protein CAC42_4273 [Sphaceloma murrayae]
MSSCLPRTVVPAPTRSGYDSSDSLPADSFINSSPGLLIPPLSERKSSLSKSAPTTPGGTKKHAHFDEVKIEHRYSLQRTITAPSSFESMPTILLSESNEPREKDYRSRPPSPSRSPSISSVSDSTTASDGSEGVYMDAADSKSMMWHPASDGPTSKPPLSRFSSDPGEDRTHSLHSHSSRTPLVSFDRVPSDSSSSAKSTSSSLSQKAIRLATHITKQPAACATTHVNVLARVTSSPHMPDVDSGSLLDTRLNSNVSQSVTSPDGSFKAT